MMRQEFETWKNEKVEVPVGMRNKAELLLVLNKLQVSTLNNTPLIRRWGDSDDCVQVLTNRGGFVHWSADIPWKTCQEEYLNNTSYNTIDNSTQDEGMEALMGTGTSSGSGTQYGHHQAATRRHPWP